MEPPFSVDGEFRRQNGPKHRLIGFGSIAGVQQADQGRHAKRSRHQHHLVVGVGLLLTNFVEERRSGFELRLGQPHLPDESVKMPDKGNHDFTQPRVQRALHDAEHRAGQVLRVTNDHLTGIFRPSRAAGSESSRNGPCENCAPGGIRTPGPCLRRAVLYPLSYGRNA